MNNQRIIERKIENFTDEQTEKKTHLTYLNRLLFVSFVLTFLLYLAFSLSLYVGDIFKLQTIIDSFLGGAFGLAFFAIISLLLAFVLAGTKHAAYLHFSMFRTVKIILLLMVFTGILAEVFNSSGVQDSKARTINSGNAEYNALVNSNSAQDIKIDSALVSRIAHAEKILARCKTKLAAGKEKHCNGDAANLKALKDSQSTLMNTQLSASTANQSDKFKRLDEIKHESYNPVIRSLSESLGIDIAAAISLLMLIFAALFEAMHYYLSVMRRDTLDSIKGIQNALDRAEIDFLNEADIKQQMETKPDTDLLTDISDYPEENRVRWKQSDVTAKKQNYVGFINPNVKPMESKKVATSDTSSNRPAPCTVHGDTRISDTRVSSNYERLKSLILNRDLSVTYRPIKAWMKAENIGKSDKERQALTTEYLEQMYAEKLLSLNPANDGTGIKKAKYILTK